MTIHRQSYFVIGLRLVIMSIAFCRAGPVFAAYGELSGNARPGNGAGPGTPLQRTDVDLARREGLLSAVFGWS